MRPHWLLWVPLGIVVLWAGYAGLRYGVFVAAMTETEAIERYAARYLADRARDGTGEGAALSDCVAYPAAPEDQGIWLIVSCGPTPYDAARHYEYYVDRLGQLQQSGGPTTWRSSRGGA